MYFLLLLMECFFQNVLTESNEPFSIFDIRHFDIIATLLALEKSPVIHT